MLKDYFDDFPLLDKKSTPKNLIASEKADVFGRVGTNADIITPESDFDIEDIMESAPRVLREKKTPLIKRVIPIAAVAAAIAAAVPVGVNVIGSKREIGAASSHSAELLETVPTIDEIAQMDINRAELALKGFTADELKAAWGKPDSESLRNNYYGCIWNYKGSQVVVGFDAEGKNVVEVKTPVGSAENYDPVKELDNSISETVLTYLGENYLVGECPAEGHIILGIDDKGDTVNISALVVCGYYEIKDDVFKKISSNVGYYEIEDDDFEKISGNVPTPALFIFTRDENGNLRLKEMVFPDEFADADDIKKMFPDCYDRCIEISELDRRELENQEINYVERYIVSKAVPPIEDIAAMTDAQAVDALRGIPFHWLNNVWGYPSDRLTEESGYIWSCSDSVITVYFNSDNRAKSVLISKTANPASEKGFELIKTYLTEQKSSEFGATAPYPDN